MASAVRKRIQHELNSTLICTAMTRVLKRNEGVGRGMSRLGLSISAYVEEKQTPFTSMAGSSSVKLEQGTQQAGSSSLNVCISKGWLLGLSVRKFWVMEDLLLKAGREKLSKVTALREGLQGPHCLLPGFV